jgi:hypothetical protein
VALPLLQNFSEGTSGTTLTTASTAGTGQSAFNAVTVGSGSTAAFSNAQAATGSPLSAVFATSGAGNASYVSWTTSIGSVTSLYGRAYLYLSSLPSVDDCLIRFEGSGTFGGGIMVGTTGQLRLQNAAFGETITGPTLSAGGWLRLEWHVAAGAAGTASASVSYFASPNGTTATSIVTDTAGGYGHSGVITEVDFGWTSAHPSQPSLYLANLGLSATGYLGPVSTVISGGAALSGPTVADTLTPILDESGNIIYDQAGSAILDQSSVMGSGSGISGAWSMGGAAALSGSGSMAAAGISALRETAALSGSGSLQGMPVGGGNAALSGQGALGGAAYVALFAAGLSGSGSLGALGGATYLQYAALSGSGTLSLSVPSSALSGSGTLGISGEILGFVIGLSGSGTLSVLQVFGGLVAGSGGAATPQALPGSSQVAVAPPGSQNWQWLGTLGQVTGLTYSFVCPGGCDQMSLTLMVPASYRTQLFDPGWQVKIIRGGHQIWSGKLDEPAPSAAGWTLTAVGSGNRGTDFLANYTSTWPTSQPDESINNAISRGLPWVNPGIGQPSGMWLGQEVDPAAQTVAALLNLVCTRGGLVWYVNSQPGGMYAGDDLSVFPLPTVPNRLLVCTTPVARTLGGDINTIFIRYQTAADNSDTGAAATFTTTSVQNAADVAAHQVIETFIDLSSAGTMTQAAAQGVAQSVLQIYARASFAGPFTASYGQLLNIAGSPIDPGTDQAGNMVQMVLTDFGLGGEVVPGPIQWIVGAYSWDDFAQLATLTPYQDLDTSLTGLLSLESTVLTPITVAS